MKIVPHIFESHKNLFSHDMCTVETSSIPKRATTTTKLNNPTNNPIRNNGPTTSNTVKHKNGGYFVVTALIAVQFVGR